MYTQLLVPTTDNIFIVMNLLGAPATLQGQSRKIRLALLL